MDDKVKKFLESGLLELYVYGGLEASEEVEVRHMIDNYPEVNGEYQVLQQQLETTSLQQSKSAPTDLKAQILSSISEKEQTKTITKSMSLYQWIAAATVLFGIACLGLFMKANKSLSEANETIAAVKSDCEKRQVKIQNQAELIAFLQSDQTSTYELKGNPNAPTYKAKAYVNLSASQMVLHTSNLEKLPEGKCLQLWGDLEGKMIPIAVLDQSYSTDILEINPNYESLNLTIEDVTANGNGQDHPDVTQLIANVLI